TCDICDKVCVDSASYKRHMKGHSSDRSFQCEICSKAFIDACGLKRHMKIHVDDRPFACDLCFKSFIDRPSLTRHQQTHIDRPRMFSCQTCGKAFTDKHGLTRHERTHTGLRPFECGVCGKTFSESGSFKRHEKIHTGIRKFSCIVCGKRFLEKQSLLRHQRIVCGVTEDTTKNGSPLSLGRTEHPMASSNLNSSSSNGSGENGNLLNSNTSSLMSQETNSVSSVESNPPSNNHSGGRRRGRAPKKAPGKPQEGPSLQSLMQKDPNLYAGISDLVESIDSYEQMLGLLRKHQSKGCLLSELQVPASFMVPCPQCNRVFATTEMQVEHEAAIHKGELRFECDICLKRFSEAFNLKRHRRLHMAVCTGCDREFKDVKLLAEHQRTECLATAGGGDSGLVVTKEDSFPCPECGREYTTRANLERHKKFHSSLKPHVCELCPKRFTEAFKLKRHMKVHSETKPHVCSNCNKGFSNAQGLRQHLHKTRCLKKPAPATPLSPPGVVAVHPQPGLEPPPPSTPVQSPLPISGSSASGFPCQVCGKAFQKKFLLVRHMNVHSVDRPYICGQCGKAYKDTSSLKRHCLVHRGVKDCVCPDCGKAFFYSDSLKRH
ncbi:hypothetical protein EGW08_023060, partial [Elysia chlorotica]